MQTISKNVFLVNCEKEKFEGIFSRKKTSEIINYHEIKQRLTNNDIFKTPPSSEVIEYQIIKRLNAFSRCKKSEFLFFYTEFINSELLSFIKTAFTGCQFPVIYHLVIENEEESSKIKKEFNTIQFLENQ